MTDLDRKIAELKGWRPEKPFDQIRELDEVYWLDQNGKRTEFAVVGFYHCDGAEGWDHGYHIPEFSPSCSTSQAFELVDEVETLGLYLQLKRIPPLKAPGMPYFEAEFANLSSILNWARDDARCYRGVADKAPEAICRAYIALKEWEKKR